MLELIQKIKTATEAGCILEKMELFNELEELHNDTMSLMGVAIDFPEYKENRLTCFDGSEDITNEVITSIDSSFSISRIGD